MSVVNQANTDKFTTNFSNVPVPTSRSEKLNLSVFDNYVRMVTLPDFNIELVFSDLMQTSVKNPISRFNNDISPVTVDFTCDEDLENYISLFEWMQELRLGNPLAGESTLRESTIKSFIVTIKDNQDRSGCKFIMKDLIIINLSSLSLAFGSSEQSVFTATFSYNYMDIERGTLTLNN